MAEKRCIEIFSADCPLCQEAEQRIRALACEDCDVTTLDMGEPEAQEKARRYGVATVPAVAVDGHLAGCCNGGGIDYDRLTRLIHEG